jgi:hypothetical protein
MHCLVFEVKSIQSYIFATGRLRDAIGGSELIDLLTNKEAQDNLLDAVLRTLQARDDIVFSRRAGGAFYAFSEDGAALDRFAALWSLALQQWAPGLAFVLGRGQGRDMPEAFEHAKTDAHRHASIERPMFPVAAPVAERAARTGRVAVEKHPRHGAIDAATRRTKQFADLSRAGFIERYSPRDSTIGWRDWPRNLEPEADDPEGSFPFIEGQRNVALIHADGNGMGQVLIRIGEAVRQRPEDFQTIYATFSRAVDASTRFGAQQATCEVLIPNRRDGELLAARPILLGGDDVIVLVRADLALAYVESFARAFEQESMRQLAGLKKLGVTDLPERLTMGFGLAYIGANQPFAMAAELAESIMAHAKTRAKRAAGGKLAPSSVAFYRVTTAMMDDYDTAIERVMSHREGRNVYTHTLGTYALSDGSAGSLPKLSDLNALVALLHSESMARGPLRGLLNLLQLDPSQARSSWRRWRQLMKNTQPQALQAFDDCIQALLPTYRAGAELPYAQAADGNDQAGAIHLSPLGDALELLALHHIPLSDIRSPLEIAA